MGAVPAETAERMGDYGVLRRMAVGGMAELFLARKEGATNVDRLVVLKRILPQFAHNEEFVRMFLNEARIASTLHHPNIVQVHSIGEERGQYFFAMEYLHGEDLARILARAEQAGYALQLDSVLSIMIRVCAGLHYAHERTADGKRLGIVHRDVSPHNVFVTYDGGVKLLDFGIAKATTSIGKTKSGALKGKVEYMSPEQAFSQPVDRRSDIFCIGILLWELTTGRRLYRRRSDLESLKALTEEDAPAPSSVVSSYPAELERIVLKCLRRVPEERWETCEELQAALDTFGKTQSFTVSPLTAAKLMHVLFSAEIAAFQHAVKGGGSLTDHIIARVERIAERAAAESWDAEVANVIVNLGPNDDVERKFSESGAILVEADEPEPKPRGLPQGMMLAPLPGAAPLDKIVEPPTGPMTLAALVLPVAPAPIPMPVLVQGEPTEIMAVPPVHEPDPLPGLPPPPEAAKTAAGSITAPAGSFSTPSTTSRTEVSVTFDAIPKGVPDEPNTEALTTPHPGRIKPILGTAILARDTSPPEPEPLPPPAPSPRRFVTFGLIAFVAAGIGAFVAVQLMKRSADERPPAPAPPPAVAAQPAPTPAPPPPAAEPTPPRVAEPTPPTPPEAVAAAEPEAESPAEKKKNDAKADRANKADKADKAKARAKRAKKTETKKKRPSNKDLDSLPI